jgi:pyroglutamyl-peptidase
MTRLLITGFEPFGGERVNPSAVAAQRLACEDFPGVEVSHLVLPVVRFRCIELVVDAVERARPDVVVMLGQAGSRPWLTPERVAIKLDDYRIPDNAGGQPVEEPIVPGGPAAYFSTLPVKDMVRCIQAAGVPAAVSNTAGTFLCNHVSYGVLHHLSVRRLPVTAGFIHLPLLPDQAAAKGTPAPCMSIDTMVHGLGAGIAAALTGVTPVLAPA